MQLDRVVEVLEHMLTHRHEAQAVTLGRGRLSHRRGDHDLAAVAGCGDARRLVHGQPHVVVAMWFRAAAVKADANRKPRRTGPRLRRERALDAGAGAQCGLGIGERCEHRIADRPNLDAPGPLDLFAQQGVMSIEGVAVGCLTQRLQ